MDCSTFRDLFPVTAKSVYLNNAAETPLNTRVRDRLLQYLTLATEEPQNKPTVRGATRTRLSEIFGGSADEFALVTSTGVGIGIVAAGYQWQAGDNMVLPEGEHWNNTFPWLALRDRGVDVRLVPVDEDYRVDPGRIAAAVDRNTRILATAAVRFDTGFRTDLKMLSTIARDQGALLMVDGIQAGGMCPINVQDDGIDILACAGFKWLLGMHGTGFLYINQMAQQKIGAVIPGMFAAEKSCHELNYLPDARQYETGTIAYGLFHAWIGGLELLQEVGIGKIHNRVIELTDRLIDGLRSRNISIVSPVDNVAERSAIISFTAGPESANDECFRKLKANNVQVAEREGRIRVSPNFFNSEQDIDRLLELL